MTRRIQSGDRVIHPTHGLGTVVSVTLSGIAIVQFNRRREYVEVRNLILSDTPKLKKSNSLSSGVKKLEKTKPSDEDLAEQDCLRKIRELLEKDFLNAEAEYRKHFSGLIEWDAFEQEKCAFVKSWLKKNLANRIHGPPLDDEQIAAVSAVNGNIQVIARAGSGKTTTLVVRTFFLIKHCGISPSEILLLAFNRKAALSVQKRLLMLLAPESTDALAQEILRRANSGKTAIRLHPDDAEKAAIEAVIQTTKVDLPHVMTFHALALSIVPTDETILYDDNASSIHGLSSAIQDVIDDHLSDPVVGGQIRSLMLAHFREDWEKILSGGFDLGREALLAFRRALPRETLRGESVKSWGEKVIADFLFEHDIAYKYERNHWWGDVNYRPDFTLFLSKDSGVIIEYFGLLGDPDYDEMSNQKRIYWLQKPGWKLIEIAPYEVLDIDLLYEQLGGSLAKAGFPIKRLSEDELWHRVRKRAIDRFTGAVKTFVGRCRKLSLSPPALADAISAHKFTSPIEKTFIDIAETIYTTYLHQLTETQQEDFDGLMQRAASAVESGQTLFARRTGSGDLSKIRFISIDEFQDFSALFFRLISAIRSKNARVELFCVGDDWQAINGFAGSDLRFFQDFEKHVGDSRTVEVATNYRSVVDVVEAGNALMKNRGSPAKPHRRIGNPVISVDLSHFQPTLIEKHQYPGEVLLPALLRIIKSSLKSERPVVLLARRNGVPWFVNQKHRQDGQFPGLEGLLEIIRSHFPKELRRLIGISTAHKYKGLEMCTVVILDAVTGSYPLLHPDWIFLRIFGDSTEKIIDDERRLFYVAITRAIDNLFVITENRRRSLFLDEINSIKQFRPIAWQDYPPVSTLDNKRLVVRLKDIPKTYVDGTRSIKELIKACHYFWHTRTYCWEKSFLAAGFGIDRLQSEVWAQSANNVEVVIYDDQDIVFAHYNIFNNRWIRLMDDLDKFINPSPQSDPVDGE